MRIVYTRHSLSVLAPEVKFKSSNEVDLLKEKWISKFHEKAHLTESFWSYFIFFYLLIYIFIVNYSYSFLFTSWLASSKIRYEIYRPLLTFFFISRQTFNRHYFIHLPIYQSSSIFLITSYPGLFSGRRNVTNSSANPVVRHNVATRWRRYWRKT